ncbi:hypothetical protein EB796_010994 [Bugula neritina]|uniref:CANT1 n=1 Tax=Bugula neritina TaxID=10212 RepID=A0A7J7JXS0_BUGNE|nr:hypothetical protein EB796_010994 [Bugula neritina]
MIVSRGSSKELTRLQDSKEKKFSPGNGSEMDDWQRAISTPTRYRVGASSINLRPKDVIQICLLLFVVVFVGLVIYTHSAPLGARKVIPLTKPSSYSDKYPLSAPITTANGRKFRIAVITDLDHGSKVDDSLWQSHYLKGFLIAGKDNKFKVEFDSKSTNLYNSLAQGGRGMELSELVVYNEDVITVDDRTGVVYKIVENVVAPWVILSDGPGNVSKGFKSEWATVKDGYLYIGGLGKNGPIQKETCSI